MSATVRVGQKVGFASTHDFSDAGLQKMANDAVAAIQMMPAFRPEVILLDLGMPNLDGEQFLRGLQGLPASRGVPVVLISAKDEVAQVARRAGAAGYLHKPFEAPQLLSILEKVFA